MGYAYAYNAHSDEEYANPGVNVPYGGQVQYVMQNSNPDMNQMRPQMQHSMQHGAYILQPHPSMQPQIQQVQYDPNANVGPMYHHNIASTPPPPSPYDPVSPAQSLSDHSASGTESAGAVSTRVGGVPIMPARVYHQHSHSHSSQGSSSSLHGEHPYATPHYAAANISRGHSRTRSIGSRSVETTPPPGHPQSSDEDFDRHDTLEPYVNQINLLNRKESTRRQRIQAEQRRRDELRDGYSRLKEVLPITTSKSSKVSLIERARSHILDIDAENATLKSEVEELKKEVIRLQQISEQMAMSVSMPLPTRKDEKMHDSPSISSMQSDSPFEHIGSDPGTPLEESQVVQEPEKVQSEREKTPSTATAA